MDLLTPDKLGIRRFSRVSRPRGDRKGDDGGEERSAVDSGTDQLDLDTWNARASFGHSERVIEAVVFDLDGVLIDSEPVWEEVRRGLVVERGGTGWRSTCTACWATATGSQP